MIKTIITGNLTNNAEVRTTPSGKTVCGFTVAVNHGSRENPRTDYFKCSIWGQRAEGKLPEYLKKGTKVLVEGIVGAEAYMPKEGNEPKAVLTLLVEELELLGGNGKSDQQEDRKPQTPAAAEDDLGW
jgi:single-strand DNA-binding protein